MVREQTSAGGATGRAREVGRQYVEHNIAAFEVAMEQLGAVQVLQPRQDLLRPVGNLHSPTWVVPQLGVCAADTPVRRESEHRGRAPYQAVWGRAWQPRGAVTNRKPVPSPRSKASPSYCNPRCVLHSARAISQAVAHPLSACASLRGSGVRVERRWAATYGMRPQ